MSYGYRSLEVPRVDYRLAPGREKYPGFEFVGRNGIVRFGMIPPYGYPDPQFIRWLVRIRVG